MMGSITMYLGQSYNHIQGYLKDPNYRSFLTFHTE